MFGFDIAIISGASPFIQQRFRLNAIQLGWAVSSLLLGCILGSGAAGRTADKFGRRRVLAAVAFTFVVSSVASGAARTFSELIAARILGGVAVGAASMVSPMYIAEISPHRIRGRMVSLCQLAITSGILISYLINYGLRNVGSSNWRWMFLSGAVPSALFFVLLFFVPESPRWLFTRGRGAEALEILKSVGGEASANDELATMRSSPGARPVSHEQWWSRHNRRVMTVGILLAILVQLSGMNAVLSYAPIILRRAGTSMDTALFQTFVIGAINLVATFVAVLVVDRVGRKPLYITGSVAMAAALILIGFSFAFHGMGGLYGLSFILLFVASFAACIGPVFWVLMSEMFPSAIRADAMSVAVLMTWLTDFLLVLAFPWVFLHVGGAHTFWITSILPLLMCLIAWKLLPETKGRTLEEIDEFWAPASMQH